MYRNSTPPPPPEHDYAIEDSVDAICARSAAWTRAIDRGGVALGIAAGFALLWLMRGEGDWGLQRLIYVVMALSTLVLVRAARSAFMRVMRARWIDEAARAHDLDPRELGHRVRMALTVARP